MKRWIAIATTVGMLSGCGPSVPEAKKEAYQRWNGARAKVLCGVARQHLEVGQLDGAAAKAGEALALDEDYTEARLLLGKVHIEQGQYPAAIIELERVLNKDPEAAEIHYLLGVAREKAGLLTEALADYRRCHAIQRSHLPAIMAATEVLVTMERVREAQLYIESYLSLAGAEPGMYELAGRIAMMQEDYPRAATFSQQACNLDPKNLRYRETLARARFHAGEHAEALEALGELKAAGNYTVLAWVHTTTGDCLMALGRPHDARDAYHRAHELQPASAGSWVNLAKASLALGDTTRAALNARQALRLDPGNIDAPMLLGYALLKEGKTPLALKVLTEAVTAHPKNGTMRCLLGRVHAARGDNAEAVRCYAAALRAEPDNQLAKSLLAGLAPARALGLK